jgi:DNA-binding transcriptional regulator YdaS (Cro superfamily)
MPISSDDSNPADVLKHAVAVVGSQSAFARLLGVSQQSVSAWLAEGRYLPVGPEGGPNFVFVVERETGISRHDLRPDIYPREPTGAAA